MTRRLSTFFLYLCTILIVVALVAFFILRDSTPPTLSLSPAIEHPISPQKKISLSIIDTESPLRHFDIVAKFGDRIIPIVDKTLMGDEKEITFDFSLAETGLKSGKVELLISATDRSFGFFGKGNEATLTQEVQIDSTPLRVEILTTPPNIRKGGSGVILFKSNKELLSSRVTVGERNFTAYKQANDMYVCFFAFPYNVELANYSPRLYVEDIAGNIYNKALNVNKLDQKFKSDSLNISESFLRAKAEEFEAIVPGNMTDVERFIKINGAVRAACVKELLHIGKDSSPEIQWSGLFLRLPKSASRAGFADHRTYLWKGEKIDEQTHLGFDLASTVNAPVPASNSGKVVFSAYLGIYGNLIIIDHGAGVQSLYSHLSQSFVEVGQTVKKGEIIAKTGKTGMAGGDHLHFGILVSGVEVTPLEWIDAKWIRDNITTRLTTAGYVAGK